LKKREITPEQLAALEMFAKTTPSKATYRRLQCVLLRAKMGWTREQIAEATGYHWRQVERIQQAYFERGIIAFERRPRIKAGRQYLSPVEEAAFLHTLEDNAKAGKITSAKIVRLKLVEQLQHGISLSAVYGLLHRQGWSIKQPRPRHPKGDEEAKCLFKKTIRSIR
jgi:transposase